MIELIEYKLKDLISQKITGEWGSEPKHKDEGVSVLRTTNFTNIGKLNFEKVVKRIVDKTKIDKKKLEIGDIIIEKSGGSFKQPVGRVVFFEKEDGVYLCNNFTTILRPNKLVYPKYLLYQLHYNHKIGRILKFQNQTTGIINLKLDKYLNSKVRIPKSINEQKKIANLLTQIEVLIVKREDSIKLLDELLRSSFLDMFGKDANNIQKHPVVTLSEISNKITDGTHQSPKFKNSGIPFLFVSNIRNNEITYTTQKYISDEDYEKLSKRTPIEIGNILLTTVGSYGNPAIIKSTKKFAFQRHIAFIQPKHELINYYYLFAILKSPIVKHQIEKKVKGVAQKTLNLRDLKAIEILLPERELQNKFATIIQQIESIKEKYQNSLDELNELFGSLSQKAFRYDRTLETKVYESDLIDVETMSIASIFKKNIETYIFDHIELDTFSIDKIQHLFETDFTYNDVKEKVFEMLEEGKIKHTLEEYTVITEQLGEKIEKTSQQIKLVLPL